MSKIASMQVMCGRGNMRLEDEADRIRALLDMPWVWLKNRILKKNIYKLYIILKN